MANIFATSNNETIVIYAQNNAIYILITKGTTPCQATVLEEDFRSNLSGFIYNQTLYYTYINTRGEIVVKSTRDHTTLLAFPTPEDATPYKEALAEAEAKVISLTDTNDSLIEANASLEKKITSMQRAIESAKEQYASLMDTATKYREEAQKWYLIAKTKKQ